MATIAQLRDYLGQNKPGWIESVTALRGGDWLDAELARDVIDIHSSARAAFVARDHKLHEDMLTIGWAMSRIG